MDQIQYDSFILHRPPIACFHTTYREDNCAGRGSLFFTMSRFVADDEGLSKTWFIQSGAVSNKGPSRLFTKIIALHNGERMVFIYYTSDIEAEYIREMVYMLVDDLYVRRDRKGHLERRIEDLETRVTEQSTNYQVKFDQTYRHELLMRKETKSFNVHR